MGVAPLTEHAAARFDSAVADLEDGTRVVVRAATDEESAAELSTLARCLGALTDGVRAQLPFTVPTLRGQARLEGYPALVVDLLPGYRVDAAAVPAGRGVATSVGEAIAAVHALPTSVVRDAGLPELTSAQARAEIGRLLDRAAAGSHVPVPLLARWSRAVAADRLWMFTSTVTLGGVTSDGFVLHDVAGVPRVKGLLSWRGLGVGDPAADLRWLSSAPEAAEDVYGAYTSSGLRTPDPGLRARARLYAEVEFARWLVYGRENGHDDVVADAVAMLTSLSDAVGDDDLTVQQDADVDEAIARLGEIPVVATTVDTSMQTDAFTDADMAPFRDDTGTADDGAPSAPVEGAEWLGADGETDDLSDADRASRATLRRWTATE